MDIPHRDIRFTTTDDGVDIAFWEIGDGQPVVIINSFGISHAELEWSIPSLASFYMSMAERYRVIRLDPRGVGLSGDPPGGWGTPSDSGGQQGMSIGEMGLDIEAVTKSLELDSFALMATMVQGPVGIAYAATHPEVSKLILCDAMSNVATSWLGPLLRTQLSLEMLEKETGGFGFTIWERVGPPDEVPQLLRTVRSDEDRMPPGPDTRGQLQWDAEPFLAAVSIPTLILYGRAKGLVDSLPDARHLASGIVGSRLIGLEANESSPCPYWSDRAATLRAIDGFLQPETRADPFVPSGFRTVVFTDIVGSTEYVRNVGDDAGRTAVRELEQQIAALAGGHGGRVVKNLGDGSLVSFGSNSSAISFALQLQEQRRDGPFQLRVGMAAGEPIQEDGDIHGTVVAHASRIGDLGDPGEVIVSDSVRQLAAGKGFTFEPRGEVSLKGFDEPERIWTVTADGDI